MKMHVDLENLKRRVHVNEARIEALTHMGLIFDPMQKLSDITDRVVSVLQNDRTVNETALS